jgi:hypothetical protein
MARDKGKFFSGIIGPYVLKVRNNRQYIATRVVKGKLKRTPTMIKIQRTFGMASSLASKIRLGFENYIDKLQDEKSQARLTGDIYRIFIEVRNPETQLYSFHTDTFDRLTGFDFNISSPQKNWLLVNPQLNFQKGALKINWPAGKNRSMVKFPANGKICKISMVVNFFRLEEGFMTYSPIYQHFLVNKDEGVLPAQEFAFTIPDGCFCVVGLFQNYSTNEGSFGQQLNTKSLAQLEFVQW